MAPVRSIIWRIAILVMATCAQVPLAGAGEKGEYQVATVFRLVLKGSINPGTKELYTRAVHQANSVDGGLLLVLLDTPGGLVTSLRNMVQATMDSRAPVVVFVYPPGAQAASAGALLTLSAHVAAMAPGTNIGAAHPVAIGLPQKDESSDDTLKKKAENDIAAMARSIAQEMGRNATWAEMAVRKSVSATAREALRHGVIDIVAKDPDDLLKRLKGHKMRLRGAEMELKISTPVIQEITPSVRERVLSLIADPNVAYVLMMIGIVGLYFELAHPGAIFPGTIGGIALLLGLYALQALSVSAVGLLLIILGAVLFTLELFIVSHGILGTFGLVSLVLGSIMLFNVEGVGISYSVLIPTLITVGGGMFAILYLAARATLSKPLSGSTALVGEKGQVKEVKGGGEYLIFIHGELWRASGAPGIREGDVVVVTGIDGLRLRIKKIIDKKEG